MDPADNKQTSPAETTLELGALIRFTSPGAPGEHANEGYAVLAAINQITAALPNRVSVRLATVEPELTFVLAGKRLSDAQLAGPFGTPEQASAYAGEHHPDGWRALQPSPPEPPYYPLRLRPADMSAHARITLDSDRLAELGLVAVGDHAQDPALEVRLLLEDAFRAVTMPAGLRPGIESDDNEDGCVLRLALIGPDGLETSQGWEEVRGSDFTASVPAAVEYAVGELNALLECADPRAALRNNHPGALLDWRLSLDELGSADYIRRDARYVVSLIVGYSHDDVVSAAHALAAALELTRDAGSDGTLWVVNDRRRGELHTFEQGNVEANDPPHIDDHASWRERPQNTNQ